jgi:hypothetical protein
VKPQLLPARLFGLGIPQSDTRDIQLHSACIECIIDRCSEGMLTEILEQCKQDGLDLNTHDEHGRIPLIEAAKHGNEAALRLLLQYGVDVNITNVMGNTPLHVLIERASSNSKFKECAILLIQHGANLNQTNIDGDSPYVLLAKAHHAPHAGGTVPPMMRTGRAIGCNQSRIERAPCIESPLLEILSLMRDHERFDAEKQMAQLSTYPGFERQIWAIRQAECARLCHYAEWLLSDESQPPESRLELVELIDAYQAHMAYCLQNKIGAIEIQGLSVVSNHRETRSPEVDKKLKDLNQELASLNVSRQSRKEMPLKLEFIRARQAFVDRTAPYGPPAHVHEPTPDRAQTPRPGI